MRRQSQDSRQMKLGLPESNDIHIQRLREENRRLNAENERLRTQTTSLMEEVERLRQFVITAGSAYGLANFDQPPPTNALVAECSPAVLHAVTKRSSIDQKVALFRNYFRGRDDVYALRGPERTGKVPYYPQRKYINREDGESNRADNLPLTDDVIRAHLQDENPPVIVGLYPLLLDETCWFVAIDFDKASWQENTAAFLETCFQFNVPAALERSRSGNGGHVWIFFHEPILARTARALGAFLLTRKHSVIRSQANLMSFL